MKSYFRADSFKTKFNTIIFVDNLIIGGPKSRQKIIYKKAFEQRSIEIRIEIYPWIGASPRSAQEFKHDGHRTCNCWANIYLIYTLFEHQHRTSGANDHYGLPSKQPEQDTTSASCKNHFSQTKPTFSFVFKQTSKGNIRRK